MLIIACAAAPLGAFAQALPQLVLKLGIGFAAPGDCTALLGAGGVHSAFNDPTGALYAEGVTLQGSCTAAASSPIVLSVQTSTVANITTPVTWTADSAQQQCTFTSPTSNATGWPGGQVACQGAAACAGSHAVNVTMTAPGAYVFGVACTGTNGLKSVAMKPLNAY
jgi:hypothetical protein